MERYDCSATSFGSPKDCLLSQQIGFFPKYIEYKSDRMKNP